jgi:pyruvoyl-dependent arginine decarboxylase (PvlArgDC)
MCKSGYQLNQTVAGNPFCTESNVAKAHAQDEAEEKGKREQDHENEQGAQDADKVLPPLGHDYIYIKPGKVFTKFRRAEQFKYLYLASDGNIYDSPGTGRLEVAATLKVSKDAHYTALYNLRMLTFHMPNEVFEQLARDARVGLFTAEDKITIFPETAHLKDRPECAGRCDGACKNTCTSDGRKSESLNGITAAGISCQVVDNIMCTPADPKDGKNNGLVHEVAHSIHRCGIPTEYTEKITQAYDNARKNNIWDLSSYAMSNEKEYFAVGTTVFFNVHKQESQSGGMNKCGKPEGQFCDSETEARNWLKSRDPQLFEILSYVYTNHQPTLPGCMTICPTESSQLI